MSLCPRCKKHPKLSTWLYCGQCVAALAKKMAERDAELRRRAAELPEGEKR